MVLQLRMQIDKVSMSIGGIHDVPHGASHHSVVDPLDARNHKGRVDTICNAEEMQQHQHHRELGFGAGALANGTQQVYCTDPTYRLSIEYLE